MGGVRIELLGEVRVRVDERELAVGPPRQRAVLVVLALRAGETVSRGELVDGVWGDEAPAAVEGSVHTYIHGLRRVLSAVGEDVVVRSGLGYRLMLDSAAVDVVAVESGARKARDLASAGDGRAAAELLEKCLGAWRGVPFSGVPGPLAEAERARLGELRFQLVEERAELLLAAGRHGDVVAELVEAVHAAPFRERLRGLLMLALYRGGRRADALAEFESARRVLVAELGLDPGPELAQLQVRMLRSDPELDVVGEPAVAGPGHAVVPAELPQDVPDFVGRSQELELLEERRSRAGGEARTLVISALDGVGGVGKTSLAVRFACRVAHDYPDGLLYLDLRGVDPRRPPMSTVEALGQLLGSLGAGRRTRDLDGRVALYRTLLSGRRMLILLDNAASAEQVRELLPGPSANLVLVTSRNRLSGLAVRNGAFRLTLGLLSEVEALELLRAVVGQERVDAEQEAAVALVELCGFLPLALRVAAERIAADPAESLRDLVTALTAERGRLDVLDDGEDDQMSSVRAVFSWSYLALEPEAARAFGLLGLFPGRSFTPAAAGVVLDRPAAFARRSLSVLVHQNLLEQNGNRYAFHDLVRIYAAELAHRDGAIDQSTVVRELMVWYLHTVRQVFPWFVPGDQMLSLPVPPTPHEVPEFGSREDASAWFRDEAPTVLALCRHGVQEGELELVWQLAWHMYGHYYLSGLLVEWMELLEVALNAAEQLTDPAPRLRILNQHGIAHSRMGRNEIAVKHLTEVIEGFRSLGMRGAQLCAMTHLASVMRDMARYEEGIEHAAEAVRLAEEWGCDFERLGALDALCELHVETGRPEEALEYGRAGLAVSAAESVPVLAANLLVNLGHAHRDLDDVEAAVANYEDALKMCESSGDRYHEALALFGLAELRRRTGRYDAARDQARHALEVFVALDGEEADDVRAFLEALDVERAC